MAKPNLDWIIGKNALREGIAAGVKIQKVFLQDSLERETFTELIKLCRKHKISVLEVPKFKLDKLYKSGHQGVLGLINPIDFISLNDLVDFIFSEGKNPGLLILDQITDVRNFGAIARSAEIFGIHGIIIGKKNSAPINQEAIKASAGALLSLPICQETNIINAVKLLKKMGIAICAVHEKANQHLNKSTLNIPIAFILGAEGEGISDELLAEADLSVSIPQVGTISSLNVSVAAGILCYEWRKQQL
jgi:23S rRNA (guanosine2251-2'-O)-methyltransferase